jgi:hypothetical protein
MCTPFQEPERILYAKANFSLPKGTENIRNDPFYGPGQVPIVRKRIPSREKI